MKHGDKNICGWCGERIRYVVAQGTADQALASRWIHDDPDYDPFKSPHTPTPANEQD